MTDWNNQKEESVRQRARNDLDELLAAGRDHPTACCMVICELLHVDADVVAGDYMDSFIDWVFEDNTVERDNWRAMVKTRDSESQEPHDFREEGF